MINQDLLTEKTKIAGLKYNVDLGQDDKIIDPETGKGLGMIMNTTFYAVEEEEEIIEKYSNNSVYTETKKIDTQLKLMSTLPSRYDLNEMNFVTSVKDQGSLGICWAFSGIASIESRLLVQNGTEIDLSERQIDYFSRTDGIKNIDNNIYSSNLALSDGKLRGSEQEGGTQKILAKSLFTGLTAQTQEEFSDDMLNDKKAASEVFESDKIKYYVKTGYLKEYSISDVLGLNKDTNVNNLKEYIYENQATVAVGYCAADYSLIPSAKYNNQATITIKGFRMTALLCSGHAGLIVGWDDNINGGVWIVKNSWGENLPYIYISYDYSFMFVSAHFSALEVAEKDWDNSYDSYNNSKDIYIDSENGEAIVADAFYFDKVNGKKEQLNKIGYYIEGNKEKTEGAFIVDVENKEECQKYATLYDPNDDNYNTRMVRCHLGLSLMIFSVHQD